MDIVHDFVVCGYIFKIIFSYKTFSRTSKGPLLRQAILKQQELCYLYETQCTHLSEFMKIVHKVEAKVSKLIRS